MIRQKKFKRSQFRFLALLNILSSLLAVFDLLLATILSPLKIFLAMKQIMWLLVQTGWTAMAKYYNELQIDVWAAFLNATLHPTVFGDKEMHEAGIHEDDGPLKWVRS